MTYLAVTKTDVIPADSAVDTDAAAERGGLWQTVVVVALVLVAAGTGYSVRKSSLQQDTSDSAGAVRSDPGAGQAAGLVPTGGQAAISVPGEGQSPRPSPLGDLATFRKITQDTLGLLNAGNQSGATTRVDDLETEWDNAEARLKPKDKAAWTTVDRKIDTVLRELRATSPKPASERAALTALLDTLG